MDWRRCLGAVVCLALATAAATRADAQTLRSLAERKDLRIGVMALDAAAEAVHVSVGWEHYALVTHSVATGEEMKSCR